MTNETLGEIVKASMEKMVPLLDDVSTAKIAFLEMKIKGKPYQIAIEMIPEGVPWLVREEIEIKKPR